jgi:prepilin-type N-terminal cleavage/methylation domain-containing protein
MAYELHSSPFVARRERGFTLVELMAVVVIVGVLSMLAVMGYRKIVTSSHVTEATSMVNNLRVAQEAYHAETQLYAPCMGSSDLTVTKWYPATSTYGTLVPWGSACGKCVSGYDISQVLPVHVDGPLLFGYQTIAGPAAATATSIANNCNATLTSGTADYYAIAAEADLDGNSSTTTDVCATSWSNQIVVWNEGL